MPDEINFFDLASLLRVKPDTTMERFGGMLNSSYFDGANIAATLSQKKLISFNTALPGQSIITITDAGKQLIDEANMKAKADFDHLDLAIITQISNGKSSPGDIGAGVNVRPRDLAMHLNKLSQQEYITYEFRSGAVSLMLTEKGFQQVKEGMPRPKQQPQPQPIAAAGAGMQIESPAPQQTQEMQSTMLAKDQAVMEGVQTQQEGTQASEGTAAEVEQKIQASKSARTRNLVIAAIALVVILVIIFAFLEHYI